MKALAKIKSIVLLAFAAVVLALAFSCREKADEETMLLYARASAAYAQGRFDETAKLLEDLNFPPALLLRAKALYFENREAEAERLLRKTLRRHPGGGEASLFLARILREQGKDDEARTISEKLLEGNPQDIRVLRLASDMASRRGETEEAAALLDRAVEASAETALVFVDRAKLRWSSGNGSGALDDLRRAELLLPWNTSLHRGIGDLRKTIVTLENSAAPHTAAAPDTAMENTGEEQR